MRDVGRAGEERRPVLIGDVVRIRPARTGDIPVLLAILDEPEVARWWRRSEWERIDETGAITFAIESPPTAAAPETRGRVVGCIQYVEEDDPDYRSAAVDIFVSAACHGCGIGPDAMRTLITWLLGERGQHRLTVDPAAANAHAIHVYTKLGFRPVGVLRQYERVEEGVWRDALLMELLAEDFVGA